MSTVTVFMESAQTVRKALKQQSVTSLLLPTLGLVGRKYFSLTVVNNILKVYSTSTYIYTVHMF